MQVAESRQKYDKNNTLRMLIATATVLFIDCTLSVFPAAVSAVTIVEWWDW